MIKHEGFDLWHSIKVYTQKPYKSLLKLTSHNYGSHKTNNLYSNFLDYNLPQKWRRLILYWDIIIVIDRFFTMASFFISLDKDVYSAGETVSGEVLLNITAGISGFSGISLQLTGFESVKTVNTNLLPEPLPPNQ